MTQGDPTTLVLHMGALGDLVLALPAIAEIARQGPVEAWGPSTERLSFALAPRGPISRAKTLPHLLFRERNERNDAPTEAEVRSLLAPFGGIVAFLDGEKPGSPSPLAARVLEAGGCVIAPFAPGSREGKGEPVHAIDFALDGVARSGLGREGALALPVLDPTDEDREAARKLLATRGVRSPFVAVHPGAGGIGKRWPADRFAEATRRACSELSQLERSKTDVVVLLGPAEIDGPRDPALALGSVAGAVIEMPGTGELVGLLSLARAYLGNDSGVTHVAAALGTPTVAAFGPTDPARWGPRGRGTVSCLRAPRGDLSLLDALSVSKELVLAARSRRPGGKGLRD